MKSIKLNSSSFYGMKIVLPIAVVIIIFGILILFRIDYQSQLREINKDYVFETNSKANEVEKWFRLQYTSASFFQQTTFFTRGVYQFIQNQSDSLLRRRVKERLLSSYQTGEYENIYLFDSKKPLVSAKNFQSEKFEKSTVNAIQKSLKTNKIQLVDIYWNSFHQKYFLEFIVPLSLPNIQPRIAIVLRINPDKSLCQIIRQYDSTKYFLVQYSNNDLLLFSDKNHNDSILQLKADKTKNWVEILAFQQIGKPIKGKDISGKDMVALMLPVKGTNWFLLAMEPENILYARLYRLENFALILTVVILLLIFAFFSFIAANQRRQFYQRSFNAEHEYNINLQKYRTILYSIGDAVITTDEKGIITLMNKVAEALTGYAEDEAKGKPLADIFVIANEFTLDRVENPVIRVIRENKTVGLANHTVLISHSGEIIPIMDSGSPVIDEQGNLLGVVLVFRDQREIKLQEQKTKEAEHQYSLLFDSLVDGMALHEIVFDEQNNPVNYFFVDVNKRFFEILSLPDNNVIGRLATEVYQVDEPPYLDIYSQVALTGEPVELETFFPPMNKYFRISIFRPSKNRFATIFQDLTEHKLLENERFRLLNILENSLNEIYVFDYYSWKFEYANQGAIRNIGYSIEELKNMTPLDIKPALDRESFEKLLEPLISGERSTVIFETYHRRKDGSTYPVEVHFQIQQEYGHRFFLTVINDISERKQVEEELIITEQKYTELFNSVNEAIFLCNPDNTEIVDVNNAVLKMFGYSSNEEVLGRKIIDLCQSENFNYDNLLEEIKNLTYESTQRFEWKCVHKKGHFFWLDITIKHAILGNKKLLIAIGRDITENKVVVEELQKSEEKFRSIFEDHAAVELIINPVNATIVEANKAASLFYGYSLDEFKNMPLDQINVRTIEQIKSSIQAVYNNENFFFEIQHKLANGEIRDVEVYSSKIMIGNDAFLHSIVHDVTQKKQIQKALSESEERFRLAFKISPDSININRMADGMYVDVNDGFCKIMGYTREEIIGHTTAELKIWVNLEDKEFLLKELKEKGACENLEAQFRCKNGTILTGLMSARIIMLQGIPHILTVTRDITSRKEMENQLIEAKEKAEESDRLKTAFLHNISHEIRTPMNAIIGFSDLLRNQDISNERKTKYINIIINSSKQLLSIVNDVLEISRIESNTVPIHLSVFNINELLEELYQLFAPKMNKIKLSLHSPLPSSNAYIEGDKEKIEQVLTNLLNNSYKYTSEGFIQYGYDIVGSNIQFFVKDSGIGIPENDHQRIFERFYQSNLSVAQIKGGSGLGLSIAKSLVEIMGGKIWLESQPGVGTSFYFTTPYRSIHLSSNSSSVDSVSLNKLKILVVEDNISNYEYLQNLLTLYGAKIEWAKTGIEAIDMAEKNNYNVILMDIKLPEMDGYEATKIIKKKMPLIPIIALTAFSLPEDIKVAEEAGCDAFLTKPVNKEDLFKQILKLSR
jgi:PAS domain S-box-containing protein